MDLVDLLAPIRVEGSPDAAPNEFLDWLARVNPELGAFNDALRKHAVRSGYRNALFPSATPTVAEAIDVDDDGCRAARIRSLFIGASAVLEDADELWLASWGPTATGTSVVFGSHQDERDLWAVTPSLHDFVLLQYREDSYFQRDLVLPPEIASLPNATGGAALDPAWDPLVLTERVHWLVALLFPEGDWYGLGDGLVTAPEYRRFVEEEPLLPDAPHLLAYWLAHHAVFDNREAFARLTPLGAASPYPPAREIASRPAWCNAEALRATAMRTRPEVFAPETIARTAAVRDRRAALRATLKAELAKRAPSAGVMLLTALLDEAKLDDLDTEIIRDLRPNPPKPDTADREIQTLLCAKRGNAPGLGLVFEQIPEEIDASWDAIATALVELAKLEPHEELAKVAVLFAPDAPRADDRVGRLAQVALALRKGDRDYVHTEAKRFMSQLGKPTTDTAALATEVSLARRDPLIIAALEAAIDAARPNANTMRSLLAIMSDDPAFTNAFALLDAKKFKRV